MARQSIFLHLSLFLNKRSFCYNPVLLVYERVMKVNYTKKFSWIVVFCAVLVLFCFAADSFAAAEKYVLEEGEVFRVKSDGKRQKIEDVGITEAGLNGGAGGSIYWFSVDPNENEAMEGSESGIYFFDANGKPLFYMPYEDAGMVGSVLFSNDGKQIVLDVGTWVVREFILFDFKNTKVKTSFTGMGELVWLDDYRFAFAMVEPDAEPRQSATDFDGWTSIMVYDTAIKELTPIIKATETANYTIIGVVREKEELIVTETSVKTKQEWADYEKYQEKEISVPFPAAG